jgi:hypothetical protein
MQSNQESSLSRLNRLDPDVDLYTIGWCADADLSHPAHARTPADSASTPDGSTMGDGNNLQDNPELPPAGEQLPHKFPKPTTLPGMWDLSDF